jgi:hypothetical protein
MNKSTDICWKWKTHGSLKEWKYSLLISPDTGRYHYLISLLAHPQKAWKYSNNSHEISESFVNSMHLTKISCLQSINSTLNWANSLRADFCWPHQPCSERAQILLPSSCEDSHSHYWLGKSMAYMRLCLRVQKGWVSSCCRGSTNSKWS